MVNQTKQIDHWFSCYIDDYREFELTLACENCAHWFDHDEWLDDSEHEVWEIGSKWFEKYF